MRLILGIILSTFFTYNTYAFQTKNCVEGFDSTGDSLTGTFAYHQCMQCNTCRTINNCENVSGVITDQDGNRRTYQGHWDGYGHIVGLAEDGDRVDLKRV